MVDTGLEKDAKVIINKIKAKWGSLENIEQIIFTHRHYDHTGGLATFLDELATISASEPPEDRIKLVTHEAEAPLFNEAIKNLNIEPNKLVKHDELIDEELALKAINNPGHTFGHLCLLLENEKLLLIGDTIMFMFGTLRPVFKKFHDDYNQYLDSLKILLEYDWDYAIPSHMRAVKIPRKKIAKFIAKMS
ncbi:MAG: MBL fold metallo-hydrolase [Candidatus Heimdallarchaeota archaeon]